jgi:predicted esterase
MKERGVVVNCIYDGVGTDVEFKEGGRYVARLFTRHGSLKWDEFEEGKLGSEEFKEQVDGLVDGTTSSIILKKEEEEVGEILVCTHGSRDCRCSNLGGQLVEALRAEIAKRGSGIEVREIAHVGGHK